LFVAFDQRQVGITQKTKGILCRLTKEKENKKRRKPNEKMIL
jgi:hypothetical protein